MGHAVAEAVSPGNEDPSIRAGIRRFPKRNSKRLHEVNLGARVVVHPPCNLPADFPGAVEGCQGGESP
jgi:hypothetical protein